jgi:hypothetical protein
MYATVLLALAALIPPAQVNVLRVAPGGAGGAHADVQSALDAAVDGDIVLVDSTFVSAGAPEAAVIDGLSVTVIGDGPTRPVLPVITVRNLPAGGQVVLRHLEVVSEPADPFTGGVVAIRDCAGTVLVEDCRIAGFDSEGINGGNGGPGLFIASSDVSLVRCDIRGGHGSSTVNDPPVIVTSTGHGSRALRVIGSRVSLHDCTVRGGDGGSDLMLFSHGGGGGLGLDSQNAQLWVVGCTVTGGEGGIGSPPGTSSFGAQIDGFSAPTTHFQELDSTFVGGTGMPGLALVNGSHTLLPGGSVVFSVASPVRPGDTGEARVSGPPGTLFGVFVSAGPGFLPSPPFHGVWLTDLATLGGPLFIDGIPASGEFVLTFPVPAFGLPDGFLNVDQVLSQQPGGELVLSNATAWVQIEDGL